MIVFNELFPNDDFSGAGPETPVGLVHAVCALADEIRALRNDLSRAAQFHNTATMQPAELERFIRE